MTAHSCRTSAENESARERAGAHRRAAHRLVRLRDAEPETGCAELDLYLSEKTYWGQGYATDTMRTMCRYGFDTMRLHKISLTVVTENHAAYRVYRKVGFVEEGRLRQVFRRDGEWYDQYTMGLLAGELR